MPRRKIRNAQEGCVPCACQRQRCASIFSQAQQIFFEPSWAPTAEALLQLTFATSSSSWRLATTFDPKAGPKALRAARGACVDDLFGRRSKLPATGRFGCHCSSGGRAEASILGAPLISNLTPCARLGTSAGSKRAEWPRTPRRCDFGPILSDFWSYFQA